ncbi:bifunctional enoyl-CoA hydratase/phosphate acetyltransferase [Thermosediminibacter litoriperuensis]|uniref:Phosphate butyryltransferase n=1 Tax=Thermosediminibacter litoriperuensis TaxID=291989 RepID=A0A5S5AXA3_9FIRM|nr:bifunctional enoyl-CoA hydratase/phosphate acetyltransferase [Thermosediminibacter litoriperuensis]TYP58494.1 phosphate butyryltransferase [Thermosediminibacter litoriperuensis]
MFIKTFAELQEKVSKLKPVRVAVAAAEDDRVVGGVKMAMEFGIVESAVLTGNSVEIVEILDHVGISREKVEIRQAADDQEAANLAVKAITDGEAEILAKGRLETVYYLKAILDSERGIKASKVLCNLTLFEMESYHKFIAVADNAIIPLPTLEEKKAIIENTKPLFTCLGIETPKVAVLAAVELVNPKMQATVDAACLSKMADRGQIKGFMVDGPLAYDVAIDLNSAKGKKLASSPVAGDPDLLLVPNLEAGNMLGKSYKFHGKAKSGGLVLGARVPVVLNSRSDGPEMRLNSFLMARAMLEKRSIY